MVTVGDTESVIKGTEPLNPSPLLRVPLKVPVPLVVRFILAEFPLQIVLAPEIRLVGRATVETVVVATTLHPVASVTVTVYNPVVADTEGFCNVETMVLLGSIHA